MKVLRAEWIAPCGFNCALCSGYQCNPKRPCGGCNGDPRAKQKHCAGCAIYQCEKRAVLPSGFCYECASFPCRRLRELDRKYRTGFDTSMLENLERIRAQGMDAFLRQETERWACPDCGELICLHKRGCVRCGEGGKQNG